MILPPEAHPLVQVLALHFTSPTYQRFSTLLVAALVTTGRRTVANLLRTLRHLAPGHRTDYQRVLSPAPWCDSCSTTCSPPAPWRSSATTPWTGTRGSASMARPATATPCARPTPT